MTFKNKGFTLIELLVVIAIIGILSSVVLASLNSARNKGADGAIKAELSNLRAQVELFADGQNGSYSGWQNNTTADQILDSVATRAGAAPTTLTGSTTAWAAKSTLKSGGYFCVDYLGTATSTTADPTITDGTCI